MKKSEAKLRELDAIDLAHCKRRGLRVDRKLVRRILGPRASSARRAVLLAKASMLEPSLFNRKDGTRLLRAVCSCEGPRIIRVANLTLSVAPIMCGRCGGTFEHDAPKRVARRLNARVS